MDISPSTATIGEPVDDILLCVIVSTLHRETKGPILSTEIAPLSCALAPLRTRTKTRTTTEVAVVQSKTRAREWPRPDTCQERQLDKHQPRVGRSQTPTTIPHMNTVVSCAVRAARSRLSRTERLQLRAYTAPSTATYKTKFNTHRDPRRPRQVESAEQSRV